MEFLNTRNGWHRSNTRVTGVILQLTDRLGGLMKNDIAPLDVTNSSEIHKFKRRMIRSVARLRQEKKPEDELWLEMKNETGVDCQPLWERMRSLTLKKLKRLLNGDDRVDAVPKAARMSATDWLLFNMVLVHEKIDVIGNDPGSRVRKGELKPLTDLFALAQKYGIEELTSDDLAEAWYQATLKYNSGGHQVSPMLLQLRWYQLKEVTRKVFYDFWYSYRGNARLFVGASKEHAPTRLQMAIAKRFSKVVTSPFMEWEDMIQKRLVILSDTFEEIVRKQKSSQHLDETAPELEVIEPVIETIDLEADSDTEKEKQSSTSNMPVPEIIKVKQEPVDVDENDPKPQDTLHSAGEKLDIESIDGDEEEMGTMSNDASSSVPNESPPESSLPIPDEGNLTVPDDDENLMKEFQTKITTVLGTKSPLPLVNTELPQITSVFGNVKLNSETLSKIGALAAEITNSIQDSDADLVAKPTRAESDDNAVTTVTDDIESKPVEIDDHENQIYNKTQTVKLEELNDNAVDVFEAHKEDILIKASTPVPMKKDDITTSNIDDIINITCEQALEKLKKSNDGVENKNISAFGELSNELNLVGDGIELVDDGIAYVDEDMDNTSNEEKGEKEGTGESAKIDLKLLLYPVVYTTNIEHMGLENFDAYETVRDKDLIDAISVKSKPVSEKTVNLENIKKEKEECEYISDDDDYSENVINDMHKVKITSYLLKKPRTRNYNPINLCKNPDFNTRLKRLNVGFFSSQRNIILLKGCKPLTIDVSKAFESKLLDGIIYLKPHDKEPGYKQDVKVDNQKVSVIPSAMPIQSLIDNQNVTSSLSMQSIINSSVGHLTTPTAYVEPKFDVAVERRRGINLPDISEIRRINQRLLTAEVTPIQVQSCTIPSKLDQLNNQQPATNITSSAVEKINVNPSPISITNRTTAPLDFQKAFANTSNKTGDDKTIASIHIEDNTNTSNKCIEPVQDLTAKQNTVVDLSCTDTATQSTRGPKPKKKLTNYISKSMPWYSREIRPQYNWLSRMSLLKPTTEVRPADEALLTIDSLNKMLFLFTCEDDQKQEYFKIPPKQMKKKEKLVDKVINKTKPVQSDTIKTKQIKSTSRNTCDQSTQISTDNNRSNDVQIISDSDKGEQSEKSHTPKVSVISAATTAKSKRIKCCWAAAKIYKIVNQKKRTSMGHDCLVYGKECKCCCKEALHELEGNSTSKQRNTSKTIESVPQQCNSVDDGCDCEDADCRLAIQSLIDDTNSSCTKETNSLTLAHGTVTDNEQIVNVDEEIPTYNFDSNSQELTVGAEISVQTENEEIDMAGPVRTLQQDSTTPNNVKARIHIRIPPPPPYRHSQPQILLQPPPPYPGSQSPSISNNQPPKLSPTVKSTAVCKCEPKLNFDVQRKIIIDGSSSCPLHKKVFSKFNPEKKIYLSSKRISDKPSDNPIFLGKNKILLTNIKFPPHIRNMNTTEGIPTAKIIPVLPLPAGVQLVLLPNGELTYTVDPDLTLDEKQLQTLPEILEAVKHQLGSQTAASKQAPVTGTIDITQDDDVVNLCEDDTNKVDPNAVSLQPITTQTSEPEYAKGILGVVSGASNSKVLNKTNDKLPDECDKNITNTITQVITQESDEIISNKHAEFETDKSEKQITVTENSESINSTEVSKDINKDHPAEINSDLRTETAADKASDDKGKNILSDLMEMSGISADDTTPAIVETTPPSELLQPAPELQSQQSTLLQTQGSVNIPNFTELSPITSLDELKYACSQKGSFFKLDFESGMIVPINVCIKRKINQVPQRKPLQRTPPGKTYTIDLTEDEPDPRQPQVENRSLLVSSHSGNDSQSTSPVKPIKLFKNAHAPPLKRLGNIAGTNRYRKNLPAILKKRLTVLNGQQVNATVLGEFSKPTTLPSRSLNKEIREREEITDEVEAAIDMVDSDCPMEEEYLENIDSDDDGTSRKRKLQSDDSSDEEPLSNIAKKMRVINKDAVNADAECVAPATDTSEDVVSNTIDDNIDDPNLYDDGPESETFSIEALDQGNDESGDEDCILGF